MSVSVRGAGSSRGRACRFANSESRTGEGPELMLKVCLGKGKRKSCCQRGISPERCRSIERTWACPKPALSPLSRSQAANAGKVELCVTRGRTRENS